MYTRLDVLYYESEQELRDPARIRRLCRDRRAAPIYVPVLFALGGLLGIGFAVLVLVGAWAHEPLKASIGALLCAGTGLGGLVAAKLFWHERALDPLRGYLRQPGDYAFADAQVTRATYRAGERRILDQMLAQGKAKTEDGTALEFFENFSARAWPYAGNEENLKPGDDWYEQKGKRPKLPVAGAVIYLISDPGRCALAGLLRKSRG